LSSADATTSGAEPVALRLNVDDISIVVAEASAAAGVLADPLRAEAERLADVAATGEVPADLVGILGDVVEASLEGGRARRLYRAEGEKALQSIYLRTPAGKALSANLAEVNRALVALNGRTIDSVRVAMRTPGSFTVSLGVDGISLTLAIANGAVAVDSLTIG